LEKKIQNIKCSLDNLCNFLDKYRESSEDLQSHGKSLDNISLQDSSSSYQTALEELSRSTSFNSYFTAIEEFETKDIPDEERTDECKNELASTLTKKSVSFSKYVTILEVCNKTSKNTYRRNHINNLKGKFVDYICRERFYIKYKWQKLKQNILKSGKNTIKKIETEITESSSKLASPTENENKTKTVDLKWFFQEVFEHSLMETDVDENSVTIVKECYSVPLTDLNTVSPAKEPDTCLWPAKEIKITPKPHIDNLRQESIIIKPRLYNYCNSIEKSNCVENNLLLQYLISKAQYPIQLKIATSIVKLSLPLWYQNSLIV